LTATADPRKHRFLCLHYARRTIIVDMQRYDIHPVMREWTAEDCVTFGAAVRAEYAKQKDGPRIEA